MNFYEKPLHELTDEEWEKICMRCGKCCMHKYSENGVIHFSNHMCNFFDTKKGICSCYNQRFNMHHTCRKVSMDLLEHDLDLLPPSCAYRRLYEGRGLPAYHPLLTGNPKSAEKAGATVKSLPVFPEKVLYDAVFAVIQSALQNHIDENVAQQKVLALSERYELKWLETYPCTQNAEKTAP